MDDDVGAGDELVDRAAVEHVAPAVGRLAQALGGRVERLARHRDDLDGLAVLRSSARSSERPMSPVGPGDRDPQRPPGHRLVSSRSPVAGEHDPRGLALDEHPRLHREHVALAGVVEQRVGGGEPRELLEVLDRREDEQQLAAAAAPAAPRPASNQRASTISLAVDPRLGAVGREARKNQVSKRILTSAGVIQRENGMSSAGSGERDPGLLRELAHGRRAQARPRPRPRRRSTAPPGKTQAPPMKRASGCAGRAAPRARPRRPASRITVAAGRGTVSSPGFSSSPGLACRCSIGRPYSAAGHGVLRSGPR